MSEWPSTTVYFWLFETIVRSRRGGCSTEEEEERRKMKTPETAAKKDAWMMREKIYKLETDGQVDNTFFGQTRPGGQ